MRQKVSEVRRAAAAGRSYGSRRKTCVMTAARVYHGRHTHTPTRNGCRQNFIQNAAPARQEQSVVRASLLQQIKRNAAPARYETPTKPVIVFPPPEKESRRSRTNGHTAPSPQRVQRCGILQERGAVGLNKKRECVNNDTLPLSKLPSPRPSTGPCVELVGFEPTSKQGNHTLSTRLFQPSVFVHWQDLDHQPMPYPLKFHSASGATPNYFRFLCTALSAGFGTTASERCLVPSPSDGIKPKTYCASVRQRERNFFRQLNCR